MKTLVLRRWFWGLVGLGLVLPAASAVPVDVDSPESPALAAVTLEAAAEQAVPAEAVPQTREQRIREHRERHREMMRRFRELAIPAPMLVP